MINCVGIVLIIWFYWTKLNRKGMGPNITAVMTALATKYHISVQNSLNIEQYAQDDCDPYEANDDAGSIDG